MSSIHPLYPCEKSSTEKMKLREKESFLFSHALKECKKSLDQKGMMMAVKGDSRPRDIISQTGLSVTSTKKEKEGEETPLKIQDLKTLIHKKEEQDKDIRGW